VVAAAAGALVAVGAAAGTAVLVGAGGLVAVGGTGVAVGVAPQAARVMELVTIAAVARNCRLVNLLLDMCYLLLYFGPIAALF
jgi:hypothetical protein